LEEHITEKEVKAVNYLKNLDSEDSLKSESTLLMKLYTDHEKNDHEVSERPQTTALQPTKNISNFGQLSKIASQIIPNRSKSTPKISQYSSQRQTPSPVDLKLNQESTVTPINPKSSHSIKRNAVKASIWKKLKFDNHDDERYIQQKLILLMNRQASRQLSSKINPEKANSVAPSNIFQYNNVVFPYDMQSGWIPYSQYTRHLDLASSARNQSSSTDRKTAAYLSTNPLKIAPIFSEPPLTPFQKYKKKINESQKNLHQRSASAIPTIRKSENQYETKIDPLPRYIFQKNPLPKNSPNSLTPIIHKSSSTSAMKTKQASPLRSSENIQLRIHSYRSKMYCNISDF